MQGEVYVPYTGISGMNMNDAGIMTADMSGSTDPGGGIAPGTLNLRWRLPGGIINTGHFGYIYGGIEGGVTFSEEQMQNKVDNEGYTEEMINNDVAEYLSRVLELQENTTNGWEPFKNYFNVQYTCLLIG